MNNRKLHVNPDSLPRVADTERADVGLDRWRDAAEKLDDRQIVAFVQDIAADRALRQLLACLFGNSPFLTQCAVRDPDWLRVIVEQSPDDAVDQIMTSLAEGRRADIDTGQVGRELRIAKRRLALAVAVADIAGVWPLERVTAALSAFADSAIGVAAAHSLRDTAARNAFRLRHKDDPERDSGLAILGMGKLGAGELNYSSDIDLIVLYDAETVETDDPSALQSHFVRLTRGLVRLLDERTADGYVFRTDLRLRPDPGATPLALSTLAAELYYESLGQNWERAAMIKARPVAGDLVAGRAFLDVLRPFIWRKNLDFAAIQDIHSIKRQIHAHRGGGRVALAGHNIKVGRGGIREIEFFVQTLQLIWGGREPAVRARETLRALRALVDLGQVKPEVASDLEESYRFLRCLEHRLQMVEDEQTQTLPADEAGLKSIAAFSGFDGLEDFRETVLAHLRTVESHYARLFEDAPSLGGPGPVSGNLVFTGSDADADTLRTIERLGFANPQAVDAAVRGWHHGRYRATRSTRAREILTELLPVLLASLSRTAEPDAAFQRFDHFLAGLPAGVQVFSMFHANPQLLDLVAEIMGQAPRLAEYLSRRPSRLDFVLTADFFDTIPTRAQLVAELDAHLARVHGLESVLDACRRWASDRKFQVGAQQLLRSLSPRAAADALSAIADVVLGHLLPRVEDAFAEQHGRIRDSALAIVAMGKLGSREMTHTSDLDLLFVYAFPDDCKASGGARPLAPSHYFARLGQRLISAVTALTTEGRLYEVDMRLRPSGHAGPVTTGLEAWKKYHTEAAWTWEHMALTRARVVAGPADLQARIQGVIRDILTAPRDPDRLVGDVADMRLRVFREHGTESPWDVRNVRGGLLDVEFMVQYLQLRHARTHLEVLSQDTRQALTRLGDSGLLDEDDAGRLRDALELWQGIQGLLRLSLDKPPDGGRTADLPEKLRHDLCALGHAVDFPALEGRMRAARSAVMDVYQRLIGEPAAISAAAPGEGDP